MMNLGGQGSLGGGLAGGGFCPNSLCLGPFLVPDCRVRKKGSFGKRVFSEKSIFIRNARLFIILFVRSFGGFVRNLG